VLDYIPLTAAAGNKRTTAELRALAHERMRGLGYPFVASEFSPGTGGVRFDVIGLGRYTRQVRIYEVKSSRADFLSDVKWERYLNYCTHFAFVAPAGVIHRWEIDGAIGLIEYGSPRFERMRANRRFGFTARAEDALCSARPSRRLCDAVDDRAWIGLLEGIAFARSMPGGAPADHFEDGAGI